MNVIVTDDFAERSIVGGFGGLVASCDNFIRMIGNALHDVAEELERHRAFIAKLVNPLWERFAATH